MNKILLSFMIMASSIHVFAQDNLDHIVVQIINSERRSSGIDTLIYQEDPFCFASSWADSTHKYFNVDGMPFSRAAAHRGFKNRVQGYEMARGAEWLYLGECVATGSFNSDDKEEMIRVYTKALLDSKDHYKILMDKDYHGIMVGIKIIGREIAMVVFSTREYENKKGDN